MYDQDDKMAEEIILHARKHLFLANNLYTLMNRVREIMNYTSAGDTRGVVGGGGLQVNLLFDTWETNHHIILFFSCYIS